jgi:mannose-6-phosphate isomerase-like protein (cupin superfamily)
VLSSCVHRVLLGLSLGEHRHPTSSGADHTDQANYDEGLATETVRFCERNAATGNAGDEMIEPHHEADDEENRTNGYQELFAVMTGHAVFTVDGEEIDAPAGTIVFVRDPALLRATLGNRERHGDLHGRRTRPRPVHRLALGSTAPVIEQRRAESPRRYLS